MSIEDEGINTLRATKAKVEAEHGPAAARFFKKAVLAFSAAAVVANQIQTDRAAQALLRLLGMSLDDERLPPEVKDEIEILAMTTVRSLQDEANEASRGDNR